jgi:serine/threonine-protein kinase
VPETGDSLSHFRLVEKIGEGGMGDVWKAVDTRLDREVAIKILPPALASDPERLDRFKAEAKAVAALNHPNIVTIHSVEESEGVHFLSMELVHGATLIEHIPRGGLAFGKFLDRALPLTDAVRAAHQQGVTHRDLKPGNVMVSHDGRVKILDFGLAEIRKREGDPEVDDLPTQTLTQERKIRGTMPYMSPEQVQGKTLDPRSDVFSAGCILYEMATGVRPFEGESSADIIAAILRDDPRPVTELNRMLPRQLDRIIRRGLEKDRERRFQTVQDLHNELDELRAAGDVEEPAPVAATETGPGLASLAVLPLANLSGEAAQEFFADGMTEALITDLAKIGGLKVISRTSVMRYKGTEKPMRDVARELGVGAVIEGSVMRAGDRVRINAQLIDASTDENLWAERYDREIRDVLSLQSEVAQVIARQVHVRVTTEEQERLSSPRTIHPDAHEAYLKGRHFWYKRSTDAVKRGLASLEKAIELDPSYAPAYAGVADSYLVDAGGYLGVEPEVAYRRAREAALKALELDGQLAAAHTSLGAVRSDYDWDWAGAERSYERAIALNPSYAIAHQWYADHLSRLGRHDEAIAQARQAREIDPVAPTSTFFTAWVHYLARRYDEAIELARKTVELEPSYLPAWRVLGWSFEEMGRHQDAIHAHRKSASLSGGSPHFQGQLGRAYALAAKPDQAREVLDDLVERSAEAPVSALDVAILRASLGDTDRAFEWLERAFDEHAEYVPYLAVLPRVDSLRSDPRFDALLQRLSLPKPS